MAVIQTNLSAVTNGARTTSSTVLKVERVLRTEVKTVTDQIMTDQIVTDQTITDQIVTDQIVTDQTMRVTYDNTAID